MANRSFPRLAAMLLACSATIPLFAQAQDEDEEHYETIIVTGAMRQGGAQDIAHFRSISLDGAGRSLPRPDSFTLEGLMGEHDLTLPETGTCEQLFCVSTHAMPASLTGRAEDTRFIGIGFASGADPEAIRAEPVSIVAVVDRSGSMSGNPIARVKEGLHAMVDAMREGDRLGIVLYGTTTLVHQPVTDVATSRAALHAAINAIAIDGSTYMEAGLRLGYQTALEELPHSAGRTRLMLFTDENPNVGNTSADGFMAQALAGSRAGVGLTTIGVGVHYDGALATRISSVRGGNLFFLPREGAGADLFAGEFENMVSEVAQDLVIAIDPAPGYRVSGVFGVPGELIADGGNGTVTVTIGSAFLSSNGGGIYATLASLGAGEGAGSSDALAEVSVSYTDAATQVRASDAEVVRWTGVPAPTGLAKAQVLVDEYLGISGALAAFHQRQDLDGAEQMLAALSDRLATSGLEGLDAERQLVSRLAGQAASLREQNLAIAPLRGLMGDWRVVRQQRLSDLSRGDLVQISAEGEFITQRMSGRDAGEEIYQRYEVNERQLHIRGTGLVLEHDLRGDRLTLRGRMDGALIVLERVT
jgi:Ca-activated chloride channel family protein